LILLVDRSRRNSTSQTRNNRTRTEDIIGMLKREKRNLMSWKNRIEKGASAQNPEALDLLKDEVDRYTE
jgi:hypothetical protein